MVAERRGVEEYMRLLYCHFVYDTKQLLERLAKNFKLLFDRELS